MEISCLAPAIDGKVEMAVRYADEDASGYACGALINVWVDDTDSRAELQRRAIAAARAFLLRAIEAHDHA